MKQIPYDPAELRRMREAGATIAEIQLHFGAKGRRTVYLWMEEHGIKLFRRPANRRPIKRRVTESKPTDDPKPNPSPAFIATDTTDPLQIAVAMSGSTYAGRALIAGLFNVRLTRVEQVWHGGRR